MFSNAYKVARIRYEQGKFEQAKDLLTELDYFVEDDPLWLPISWGKLGCEILLGRYDKARDAVKRLKYKIDDYVHSNPNLEIRHSAESFSPKTGLLEYLLFRLL